MFITDRQGGAGRLATERRCEADAAVYIHSISAAVLSEKVLTCRRVESTLLNPGWRFREHRKPENAVKKQKGKKAYFSS